MGRSVCGPDQRQDEDAQRRRHRAQERELQHPIIKAQPRQAPEHIHLLALSRAVVHQRDEGEVQQRGIHHQQQVIRIPPAVKEVRGQRQPRQPQPGLPQGEEHRQDDHQEDQERPGVERAFERALERDYWGVIASGHVLGTLQLLELLRRGVAHAAEAAKVSGKARVGVAGPFPLASGGLALVRARLPASPADDALDVLPRIGRPMGINRRAFFVVSGAINVLTPFGDVAIEVANPEAVRLLLPCRMRLLVGVLGHPGVLPQLVGAAKVVRALGSGAAGIFPFRFGRQAVAVRRVIAIPVNGLFVVAGFQALEQRALVAIALGIAPAHPLHRFLGAILPMGRVGQLGLGKLLVRHLKLVHEKRAQLDLMRRRLVSVAAVAAHDELTPRQIDHLHAGLRCDKDRLGGAGFRIGARAGGLVLIRRVGAGFFAGREEPGHGCQSKETYNGHCAAEERVV